MTNTEIWAGAPLVYAKRILELEKQLGEYKRLLVINSELVAALDKLVKADTENKDNGNHGYQSGSPHARAWDIARYVLARARKQS